MSKLLVPLHEVALQAGCTYRIDINENKKVIVHSVRNFRLIIQGESLTLNGIYDIRAFLRLYHETNNQMVKEILFNAAESCWYCINDKCTTFLMAKQRTIEFAGNSKKLCGPFRHSLKFEVTEENFPACISIAKMMFEYTYPRMHKDLNNKNKVTYTLTEKGEFYIVGYMARHNALSKSDEEHVPSLN